jgi:plasmid maintenance system antidote protein VapI
MKKQITIAQRAEILKAYHEAVADGRRYNFVNNLAEKYGVSRWTIQNIVNGKHRVNAEAEQRLTEEGMFIKGRSVLLDKDGKVKLQWVKTDKKFDHEAMKAVIDDLCEAVPKLPPVKFAPIQKPNADLLTVYPMGDPHFGLYSWDEETETGDFDLQIAEQDLCDAMERLVGSAPPTEHALICNLGDFFEADSMEGVTMRSRHKLDTDSRWLKVLRTGIRALIRCIEAALTKHKQVTVICAIGNHDDHSAMFLMTLLSHLFEKENRVKILDAPTIKHYYRHGKVLIGVHHGHTIKMADLPMQMANDRKEDWGETDHKYWWTGHIHQDRKIEKDGVLIESARTLAARNAWAAQMGYRSGRDAKAVIYHKDFGEIERHTVSVDMLRALGSATGKKKKRNKV